MSTAEVVISGVHKCDPEKDFPFAKGQDLDVAISKGAHCLDDYEDLWL